MNGFVHLLLLLAAWFIHVQGRTALALLIAGAVVLNYVHDRQSPQA